MVTGVTNAVIGKTEIETEGDVVYAKSASGGVYHKGDKVIIKMGNLGTDDLDKTLDATSNYSNTGLVFVDNENAFVLFGNTSRKFTFYDNEWVETDISAWKIPSNFGVMLFRNGLISLSAIDISSNSSNGAILSNSLVKTISNCRYIGEYNGVKYCCYVSGNDVYEYLVDENKNAGTLLLNGSRYNKNAYIDDITGRGFLINDSDVIEFMYPGDDGKFVLENTFQVPLRDAAKLITFTGADEGDYLFFGTNFQASYNATTSSAMSQLIVYKIVYNSEGKKVLELQEDLFKIFQIQSCFVQFDLRNDVLTIGTLNDVFAYKFNRETGKFEDLGVILDLPVNESKEYCYRLVYSPDMSKVMVTVRTSYNTMVVKIYTVKYDGIKIFGNDGFNYNSVLSFTGIVENEMDENEMYEVKTALPEQLKIVVKTDGDVKNNEIIVEGAV